MTREEIDTAIARHADTEILYDRPYTDAKVVRVSGPFTVVSLSPHRVLADEPEDRPEPAPAPIVDAGRFVEHILDNLRKAGVQNTVKRERLVLDRLEQWPGVYLQAADEYTEDGKSKPVAVCIGPEHGTVGTELVREAAKEAVEFADLLVVCGCAFEALVGEDTGKMGRLTVLKACWAARWRTRSMRQRSSGRWPLASPAEFPGLTGIRHGTQGYPSEARGPGKIRGLAEAPASPSTLMFA